MITMLTEHKKHKQPGEQFQCDAQSRDDEKRHSQSSASLGKLCGVGGSVHNTHFCLNIRHSFSQAFSPKKMSRIVAHSAFNALYTSVYYNYELWCLFESVSEIQRLVCAPTENDTRCWNSPSISRESTAN